MQTLLAITVTALLVGSACAGEISVRCVPVKASSSQLFLKELGPRTPDATANVPPICGALLGEDVLKHGDFTEDAKWTDGRNLELPDGSTATVTAIRKSVDGHISFDCNAEIHGPESTAKLEMEMNEGSSILVRCAPDQDGAPRFVLLQIRDHSSAPR